MEIIRTTNFTVTSYDELNSISSIINKKLDEVNGQFHSLVELQLNAIDNKSTGVTFVLSYKKEV